MHRRRAAADAILVGTGTLLADDPALTARGADGELLVPPTEQPMPVVFGARQIPEGARVRAHPALVARGLPGPLQYTGDDLAAHLADLRDRGVRSLFVEGGPTIVSALLAAGLADEVLVYVAPTLLGGGMLAIGDAGVGTLAEEHRLTAVHRETLGDDVLIRASIHRDEGHR